MANRSWLIGEDLPNPVNPETDLDLGRHVLCTGRYKIPAFWLFCYGSKDLTSFVDDGGSAWPTFVADRATILRNLENRAELAIRTFPGQLREWEAWLTLMVGCDFAYIKVECWDIWNCDPPTFEWHVPRAVAWVSGERRVGRSSLLWISGIDYDPRRHRLVGKAEADPAAFLCGEQYERQVTWG
jgi:hypothetical protein